MEKIKVFGRIRSRDGGARIKTLYISDLDGTLLRSDITISEYTSQVITDLTEKGMLFSYATARSYITATKVTQGLNGRIPIITYNGAAIVENDTGRILARNVLEKCSDATKDFLMTRQGDVREHPVESLVDLIKGDVFYFTCIDSCEKLEPLYHQLKDKYHCIYQKDIYSGEQWLEIMPQHVSKANAIAQLKEYLGADYVVAFGDGKNEALAYFDAFQMPVFSCDSGLYFDNVPDEIQPGVHVRTVKGKYLSDEEMIAYYGGLAGQYGKLTARYRNAICLVMDENHIYESMDLSIASEPFILTDTPHSAVRKKGFPLDSLSLDIKTGKYYYDLTDEEMERFAVEDGVLLFFEKTLAEGEEYT